MDLIEVDAASRTKVEDTRELLENVQYAPTHCRYKVYLIDGSSYALHQQFQRPVENVGRTPATREVPAGYHRPLKNCR